MDFDKKKRRCFRNAFSFCIESDEELSGFLVHAALAVDCEAEHTEAEQHHGAGLGNGGYSNKKWEPAAL